MKLKATCAIIVMLLLTGTLTSMFTTNLVLAKTEASEEKKALLDDDVQLVGNAAEHIKEEIGDQVSILEHKVTDLELEQLKRKIGVWKEGESYNQIIDGYGTGLRPPTEDEWIRIADDIHVVDRVAHPAAPSSVDLSATPWFPPIGNQDGEGSCTAWAVGYYVKTFQEAKEHGWDLSGAAWEGGYNGYPTPSYQNRITSPDFIYHLRNHGIDGGSSVISSMRLVSSIGACSWEKMPYDPDDSTTWPSEEAWKEAPLFRGDSTGPQTIILSTDSGIANLKNLIASYNMAVIHVDAGQYSGLTLSDFWTLDNYDNPTLNHANTVVGYDDNIAYTEEGGTRYGAFKIANSWGVGFTGEKVADGFYWISYEAMKQVVEWCDFYLDRIGYEPELVASFEISHLKRNECDITVGVGDHIFPLAWKRFNDYVDGGAHPFGPNKIVFDVTEFSDVLPSIYGQTYFLGVYDSGSLTTGTIESFAIEYAESVDPPLATVNGAYVYADRLLVPLQTNWMSEKFVSLDEDFIDNKISMATDGDGYLYISYEDWVPVGERYGIFVRRSTDNGATWLYSRSFYYANYDCHNPSIAIDPYENRIHVVYELEYSSSDHDIYCCTYVEGSEPKYVAIDTDSGDDRYPSITSEYQYGSLNCQYVSYEEVYTYNDRDLMFAKSIDHGLSWAVKKLHGEWPDYNVHCQTSITNAEGYVYIAYRWGADYTSTCEIRVDRSTDFGDSWTQYSDIDGSPNDCCFPSVKATHGGSTVLVAFQYAYSETDDDIRHSYSSDKGQSWSKGHPVFVSVQNERKPAVAVDGEGTTSNTVEGYFHVVCQFENHIKYRKAHFSNPTEWTVPEIISGQWVGEGLAITTQSRNGPEEFSPCVAWTNGRTRNIYYSTIEKLVWSIETVDSADNVGHYTSIALDSGGNPHISYWDETNSDLKYARWTGSAWSIQTVDSAGDVGWFTSIALDSSNNPHISYGDYTNGDLDLKYAKWTGSAWSIQTVDSAGDVGPYTSIALDSGGNPHISYWDGNNGDLKYARWTGSAWSIQTVDSADNVGYYTSIALDSAGNPHISYYSNGDLDLKYAKWTGSAWSIQTVDSADNVGHCTSIALDSSNNPHISYWDETNSDLKYARWTGSAWSIQTVDSDEIVGLYSSLALDSSNNPHISYYSNADLKYARWTGSAWSIQTVDSAGDVGWFTSIALDSSNNPHISYWDYTNGDLKYAYLLGSYSVTVKAACLTEWAWTSVPIIMDGSATGYSTPHTFSGLTGTHTFTVPQTDVHGHPFLQWDTGSTSRTITVSAAGTHVACYQGDASIDIWTDKSSYSVGEMMSVYLRFQNPGAAMNVRVIIKLELPGGSVYGPVVDVVGPLAAGVDATVLWDSFPVQSGVGPGTYTWIVELRNPNTNALIDSDEWAWTLQPLESASIEVWTDKTSYSVGDMMSVYLRFQNPGAATTVRVIIKLELPGGSVYGPVVDVVGPLAAGVDATVLWDSFPVQSGVGPGTYTWIVELRNPNTNALIDSDEWAWTRL